jgi:hypothetical protein
MAYQGISTGTVANDGLGDSLLTGAVKINSNFTEIYTALGDGSTLNLNTTKVAEGINLYFTDERAQDAVGSAISVGIQTGITVTYDDVNNRINFSINGVIKSRQGPFTNNEGTYTISPIDTSKSIINVISAGSGIAGSGIPVAPYRTEFLSSTQVLISRGGPNGVSLTWEVIEFY